MDGPDDGGGRKSASESRPVSGRASKVSSEGPATARQSTTSAGQVEAPAPEPPLEIEPLYPDWESRKRVKSKEKLELTTRDQWDSSIEYVLSCIASAVGLGNVWRFPFIAYNNGGGAFLIPYLIMLFLVARPLYVIEVALGQFSSRGPVGVWESVPLMKGLGWAAVALATVTGIWYVNILQYVVSYMYFGFASELPWLRCNADEYKINGKLPFHLRNQSFHCKDNATLKAQKGSDPAQWSAAWIWNGTHNNTLNSPNAALYFQYHVVQERQNLDHGIGFPITHLWVSLLICWIIIFGVNCLGAKTTGKSAYFTAIFPYVVLLCLLVRVCTLEGAGKGIYYFFVPDWEKLIDGQVWYEALTQTFFSLGIGFGPVMTYGSYNHFRAPLYRPVLIISAMDTFTSILAGVTVFGMLGVLAHHKNKPIKDIAGGGGAGLAFITYPEVLSRFGDYPSPQIFNFLFFFMLLTLGVGSATASIQVTSACILDKFPILQKKKKYKIGLVAGMCIVYFFLGLPMTTPAGLSLVDLLNTYSGSLTSFIIVLCEIVAVAWIYGMKSFVKDLDFMTERKLSRHQTMRTISNTFLMICGYLLPILFFCILMYVIVTFETPRYDVATGRKKFPISAIVCEFFIFLGIVGYIPVFFVIIYFTRRTRSFYKKWMASRTPTRHWGPKSRQLKAEWVAFKKGWDDEMFLYKWTIARGMCCCCRCPACCGCPCPYPNRCCRRRRGQRLHPKVSATPSRTEAPPVLSQRTSVIPSGVVTENNVTPQPTSTAQFET